MLSCSSVVLWLQYIKPSLLLCTEIAANTNHDNSGDKYCHDTVTCNRSRIHVLFTMWPMSIQGGVYLIAYYVWVLEMVKKDAAPRKDEVTVNMVSAVQCLVCAV